MFGAHPSVTILTSFHRKKEENMHSSQKERENGHSSQKEREKDNHVPWPIGHEATGS
jgi:hypothetical protein